MPHIQLWHGVIPEHIGIISESVSKYKHITFPLSFLHTDHGAIYIHDMLVPVSTLMFNVN